MCAYYNYNAEVVVIVACCHRNMTVSVVLMAQPAQDAGECEDVVLNVRK